METNVTLTKVNLDAVMAVYSGKPGCMCGCNGKYTYASKHRELAGKDRGYEVCDDEVNDRSMKVLVNKMLKMKPRLSKDGTYAYVDTDTRVYALYFLPAKA